MAPRRELEIPDLGLVAWRIDHPGGLRQLHLASDEPHASCVLAVRTRARDDRGTPHALEHLVLCGSRDYPVRDPYFGMARRSVHSVWNAQTGDQSTEYLFATADPTDYANLLAVVLDACFHPLLRAVDFDREVWRYDPRSDAVEGVLYNEMRGAAADPQVLLDWAAAAQVLPRTALRHRSAGDPARIPRLRLEDLVAAHRRWYRPGNALLVTAGAVDQAMVADRVARALAGVDDRRGPLGAPRLQRRHPPAAAGTVAVPVAADEDPRDARLAQLSWPWGDARDPRELVLGELLDRLLLGHAGAPLRAALEGSGLVRRVDQRAFDARERNAFFGLVLGGLTEDAAARLPTLVETTLERVRAEGFVAGAVDAARRRVVFARRCIGGGGTAASLDLALRCTDAWAHGGDPLDALTTGGLLDRLLASDPVALGRELVERLVAAPRHWTWTRPDRDLLAALERTEARRCSSFAAAGRVEAWSARADAIAAWNRAPDGHEHLPGLAVSQVAREGPALQPPAAGDGVARYHRPCAGLVHLVAAIPLPELDRDEWCLLPTLVELLDGLGCGARDYRARAAEVAARSGWHAAWYELRADRDDPRRGRAALVLATSALATDWRRAVTLDAERWCGLRFDETGRIAELLAEARQDLAEAITDDGGHLAAAAAARALPGPAALQHDLEGLGRLAWLERADPEAIAAGCAALHRRLLAQGVRLALIADPALDPAACGLLAAAWEAHAPGADPAGAIPLPPPAADGALARRRASAVNDLARVWSAPAMTHPDAPALAVAAAHLSEVELHRAIREEGGAYGAGMRYRPQLACIEASTGDDPELDRSFDTIAAACARLAQRRLDPAELDAARLVAIAGADQRPPPADEARRDHLARSLGQPPEDLRPYRRNLLELDAEAVRAAAERWLTAVEHRAAIASSEALAASSREWR